MFLQCYNNYINLNFKNENLISNLTNISRNQIKSKMEQKMKLSKKNILFIILVILLIILLLGLGYILFVVYNNYTARNNYNNIKDTAFSTQETNSETQPFTGHKELADNPVNFNSLKEVNEEIYAWIYVPGTEVDYPVLQSFTSDFFYLDHDVYKNYLFAGSIYTESCNLRNFTDRNTVLYGHNMADGSMFATLHRFEDESFFKENKYIYVYLPGRKLTYEIVSAYNYDDRHIMNSFNFNDDEVFKEYIEFVMNPHSSVSNVNTDIELDLNSKLITLSTCLNSNDDGRYLVQGVLIKDEQTN